jgi:hypothetical protein
LSNQYSFEELVVDDEEIAGAGHASPVGPPPFANSIGACPERGEPDTFSFAGVRK